MKKTMLILILLLTTFLLVSCGDPYNTERFKDNNIVELTNEEMESLLDDIDWYLESETIETNIDADFCLETQEGKLFYDGYENNNMINMALQATMYTIYEASIWDTAMYFQSDISFDYAITNKITDSETTDASAYNGSMNIYLNQAYLYIDQDVMMTSGGNEISISSKAKINDRITPYKWDKYRTEIDAILDNANVGFGMISPEIINIVNTSGSANFLKAFPAITVYKRGLIKDIRFEMDKEFIKENIYSLGYALAKEIDSIDILQRDPVASALTDEVNDLLLYFSLFSIKIDAFVKNNKVVKYDIILDVETSTRLFLEQGIRVNCKCSLSVGTVTEFPDFPDDLEEYVNMDSIDTIYNLDILN